MKNRILLLCVCAFLSLALFARKQARRVIVIGLDGISVEGLKQARTPNLDALFIYQGALSLTTRAAMPSFTLPNWTSHLTSSGPEQHGVSTNEWTLSKAVLPPLEKDADGYYPSVFQVIKEQVPNSKTAFYYNWKELINPFNVKYLDEVSFLENDAYAPNYEKAIKFLDANRKYPSLVFLYNVSTDHAGHRYRWMSSEYIRSIEEADAQIGIFINELKEKGLFEDAHILFTTDHGGSWYGHGGMSTDEMIVPWGIEGPGVKKAFKMIEPNSNINTAATILHLFKVKNAPASWVGKVPMSVFK